MKTVNMEMPVKNLTVIATSITYYYHQKKTSSVTEKKTEIQKRKEEQPAVDKPKENEESNCVKKSASHKLHWGQPQ